MVFTLRNYRSADFECLWQIDQLCFPEGISYTQMELSGFITRRNAITVVAEADEMDPGSEAFALPGLQPGDNLNSGAHDGASKGTTTGNEKIAGFIIAHPVRGKEGRILTLDIIPILRRLGLASLLMDECERRLRSFDCKQVYLETAVDNQAALRLYRKRGYEVLRTLPDYYATHSLDAFLMGKSL